MDIEIPKRADPRVLRSVRVDSGLTDVKPYRLLLWEHGTYGDGRTKIACALFFHGERKPFMTSYCGTPGAIDSDKAVALALSCFTMKPGDTDSEWFADYTAEQLEWAGSHACETLALIPYDAESTKSGESALEWHEDRLCYRAGYFGAKSRRKLVFRNL